MSHTTESVTSFPSLWSNTAELLKNYNHTRGPWKFHAQGDANQYALLTNDNRWVIAFSQNGELWTSEQIANARLIAAAPQMLLGLIALEEAARQAMAGEMALDSLAVDRYRVRDIIAQATGSPKTLYVLANAGPTQYEVKAIPAMPRVSERSQAEDRMLEVLRGLEDFGMLTVEGTECCEELVELKRTAKQLLKDLSVLTPFC